MEHLQLVTSLKKKGEEKVTRELAHQILIGFRAGIKVRADLLREAINVELMPELKKNIDFDNIPTKTTYYIGTFEPNMNKHWIEVEDLKRVMQRT